MGPAEALGSDKLGMPVGLARPWLCCGIAETYLSTISCQIGHILESLVHLIWIYY